MGTAALVSSPVLNVIFAEGRAAFSALSGELANHCGRMNPAMGLFPDGGDETAEPPGEST
jgi:hypothetical protein